MKEQDRRYSMDGEYTVRLWDGSDHRWIDVEKKLSLPDAVKLWDRLTEGGKERTMYEDFDYYDIFPSNTTMLFSSEILD